MEIANNSEDLNFQFNSSSNFDNVTLSNSLTSKYIETALNLALLSVGIVGNGATCVIVVCRKREFEITPLITIFGGLVFVDLLYCLVNVIVSPSAIILDNWVLGTAMCAITTFFDEFVIIYFVLTITAATCLLLCFEVNLKTTFVTIFITTLTSLIFPLFMAIQSRVEIFHDVHHYCFVHFLDEFVAVRYFIKLLVHVALPLIVIVAAGISLRCKVQSAANSQSVRLLMVLMIVFVVVNILWALSLGLLYDLWSHFSILYLLMNATMVYKPFVYYVMDPTFKRRYSDLFSACCRINRRDEHNMQLLQVVHDTNETS